MNKKEFKAESKKLLDMMIHSIYTHKEIFLRELISNASDAIDKLYYKQLSEKITGLSRDDYFIKVESDADLRTLRITDNGIGMNLEELENNLGTIAKSGSLDFKSGNEKMDDIDIIGQFGVGFYSAFMVSDRVEVRTKKYGEEDGFCWVSEGADGYTVEPCHKKDHGTEILLHIKKNDDEEEYDRFLETFHLQHLIRKYSDYITYPIKMERQVRKELPKPEWAPEDVEGEIVYETEVEIVNSMVPLWKKNKSEISKEEYENYFHDKFYDFSEPARVIHTRVEGAVTYDTLMFIPKKPSFDYYSGDFKKGLALYSNGVLIMEKCEELLPDHFSFVKGLVDSSDLSLNISREILQHDRQLKLIAKNLERNIKNELTRMLKESRESYLEFYKSFGVQLKYGIYSDYGLHKDALKDLILFHSSTEGALVTLREYVDRMKDGQEKIYYACGETIEKIDMLPQTELVKEKGYEILYLTDHVDEFALQMMMDYDGKAFGNICAGGFDLSSEEERMAMAQTNAESIVLLNKMKKFIGDDISEVRFTGRLKNHPVCLTTEGALSIEMEKALNAMPMDEKVKANMVLEINGGHPIANRLKEIASWGDDEKLEKYSKLLYAQARLIAGLTVSNPTELSNWICELM